MQIFDYHDKKLILLGDLHGEFSKLSYFFKNINAIIKDDEDAMLNFTNACFVVCGDCGFGFHKPKYYEDILNKLQKIIEPQNNILIFVRGNHDDPSYFNTDNYGFNFSNIKFSNDYSVLLTENSTSLCIGGAVSVDRSWRKNHNSYLNRFTQKPKSIIYWDDEPVKKDESFIEDLRNSNIKVDSIISHTFPMSLTDTGSEYTNNDWLDADAELLNDITAEWDYLTKIYNRLNDETNIKWWVFGHYHRPMAKFNTTFNIDAQVIGLNTFNHFNQDWGYYSINSGLTKDPSTIDEDAFGDEDDLL